MMNPIPYIWVFFTGMLVGVFVNSYYANMREIKRHNKIVDKIIDIELKKRNNPHSRH